MNVSFKMADLYKGVDPYRVYDELAVLGDNVKPAEIVEAAKDEESELHKCFEWDDSVAAEKYRLQQARAIIVNLVYAPKTKEEEPVRCFQITTERCTYQPTKQFLVQENEYQSLLARAKAELESFKRRYATLTELESVFEAIESI